MTGTRKRYRLSKLDLTDGEVSLVESGDDPTAKVVLFKSEATVIEKCDEDHSHLKSGERCETCGYVMKTMPEGRNLYVEEALRLNRKRKQRKPIYKSPHDGDGDGFYSPGRGMPDKTPMPRGPSTRLTMRRVGAGNSDMRASARAAFKSAGFKPNRNGTLSRGAGPRGVQNVRLFGNSITAYHRPVVQDDGYSPDAESRSFKSIDEAIAWLDERRNEARGPRKTPPGGTRITRRRRPADAPPRYARGR